jgi:hypothetical protein
MRMFVGMVSLGAVAVGLALVAPVPSFAGDYGYGHYDSYRTEWGNTPYNAYNSYDGYARRDLGYWERPSDRNYRCSYRYGRRTCYGSYNGYYSYGGGYGYGGYPSGGQTYYYPGYGYDTPSPAFPAGPAYGGGYAGRDPQRSQWCAWRYRSYDWRTGYYRGYDGYLHYCG